MQSRKNRSTSILANKTETYPSAELSLALGTPQKNIVLVLGVHACVAFGVVREALVREPDGARRGSERGRQAGEELGMEGQQTQTALDRIGSGF